MQLITPSLDALPSYCAALHKGFSPNNMRPEQAQEELLAIETDAAAFLQRLDSRTGPLAPVILPDGRSVPRLPGFRRWMWDGEFCGSIGLRWQAGSHELPPYCLGHIGYAVVPWKRRRGYATEALRQLLPQAWAEGLVYVELTTAHDHSVSQRVIAANGGVFVHAFDLPEGYGQGQEHLYRIHRPTTS